MNCWIFFIEFTLGSNQVGAVVELVAVGVELVAVGVVVAGEVELMVVVVV